jgi:uncharacterized integral membrane protein (TIGR00697 family)
MNELLFILFFVLMSACSLLALRLGKTYLFAFIAVLSVVLNIFVTKQFTLFGFWVTGGNVLYGVIFLSTDMISEHFGEKDAYKAVRIGIMASVLFLVTTQFLLAFAPNSEDFAQPAIETLFSITPRILVGSLLAFIVAQNIDIYVFHRLKNWTNGKQLWLRNLFSTLISQFFDTLIFTAVGLTGFAFLPIEGIISPDLFWSVAIATYVIKVLVALLDTPFMYLSRKMVPQKTE